MYFYYIKEQYVTYLKQFDNKVSNNKDGTRPYVGVVLEVNDVKYYVPFSSPKQKHLKMRNTKDFRKIAGGKLGAINFNNMIPVTDKSLTPIEFDKIEDEKYRNLLRSQYIHIGKDWDRIIETASTLRELFDHDRDKLSEHDQHVLDRCCNFPLLEEKCKAYES